MRAQKMDPLAHTCMGPLVQDLRSLRPSDSYSVALKTFQPHEQVSPFLSCLLHILRGLCTPLGLEVVPVPLEAL